MTLIRISTMCDFQWQIAVACHLTGSTTSWVEYLMQSTESHNPHVPTTYNPLTHYSSFPSSPLSHLTGCRWFVKMGTQTEYFKAAPLNKCPAGWCPGEDWAGRGRELVFRLLIINLTDHEEILVTGSSRKGVSGCLILQFKFGQKCWQMRNWI